MDSAAGMHRAVINTILSLTGSCVSTFMVSALFNEGKFHMEDILNASLAGGVVIGSACDLITYPFTSLICGFLAGVISTIGFKRISRFLEHHIDLFDTAGINNLHGMPGLLGGILSAIVIAGLNSNNWGITPPDYNLDGFYKQGGLQIAATFTSLGFGLLAGAITGFTIKYLPLEQTQALFEDKPYWIKCVPDPYEHLSIANRLFAGNTAEHSNLKDSKDTRRGSPERKKNKHHKKIDSDNSEV